MQDNIWLRLITVGLVLAALAIGYFLLSGKLSSNSTTKVQSQTNKAVSSAAPAVLRATSSPAPTPSPLPASASAYTRIANRIQGGVQTLPRTGFPVILAVVFSTSAMISGWGLRRFPH